MAGKLISECGLAMVEKGEITCSNAPSKLSARLRLIGAGVLFLGLGSACIVYWIGTRSPDVMDDPLMTGYSRAESRQIQILVGKMGLLMVDILDSLKQPGTQAFLITAVSALVAIGCFYFAGLLDDDAEAG